jgi:hypothetical protein
MREREREKCKMGLWGAWDVESAELAPNTLVVKLHWHWHCIRREVWFILS